MCGLLEGDRRDVVALIRDDQPVAAQDGVRLLPSRQRLQVLAPLRQDRLAVNEHEGRHGRPGAHSRQVWSGLDTSPGRRRR